MIPSAEAKANRVQTLAFIKADIDEVILRPRFKIGDGAGGHTITDGSPREPQIARVIPLTSQATERISLDGRTVLVEFILMMQYDAEAVYGDRFWARGRQFEVVHVQEKRDYQVKAELITIG